MDYVNGVTAVDASEASLQSVDESRPSVHTTSFHQQSLYSAETSNKDTEAEDAVVSADQERQVLLLMLLAQVCALHDPTPKTFTIHVVELFERGILDKESIHFLFELGLVPSISPTITRNFLTAEEMTINGNLTAAGPTSKLGSELSSDASDAITTAACEEIANELAFTTTTTTTINATSTLAAVFAASVDPQRSAEAYAIRATLAQYEQLQQNRSAEGGDGSNLESTTNVRPWDAKHFPLSLSRYQREFVQIALLASGSFGQVFHATRKMDGCDYAIKKVDFDATGYSDDTIQEVVREVECLAKVSDHPNVVRYYTSWLEPSWMTGGQAVEATARATSPSSSPTRAQRRRQQQQRLLLTNQIQDLTNPGSVNEDGGVKKNRGMKPSEMSYENSQFYYQGGSDSFASQEASSNGVWQHRRQFSFESSVESGNQSWGNYHDQSLKDLEHGTIEDDSSSSLLFMKTGRYPHDLPNNLHRERNNGRHHTKASYRYQISMYIQMQLCHPASLADWIRERNSKVPEKHYEERIKPALEIFEQIVQGLAHVHEKGIIHRDLKPANIFASKDGKVIKIGDFGLSKQLLDFQQTQSPTESCHNNSISPSSQQDNGTNHDDNHWNNATKGAIIPRPTQSTAITHFYKTSALKDPLLTAGIGTRSYAAPEQLSTKTYSTAADIFSLGLIFLELVCCFETEHERLHNFQQCRQQQGVQRWLTSNFPEIANIILACTQPDPQQRPSAKTIIGILAARRIHFSSTSLVPLSESPKGDLHNDLLRRSLERRDRELEQHKKELAEKDKVIEKLRREMERIKASLSTSDIFPQNDGNKIDFVD